ncbi:HoxN/HupN/NixA family nickel/cobalt transporter [Prosthecobacter dejongeii]|uniref:Nickel/cobalt efflux system n=1 Tax=Prosthecobacter dejongeii TaxID=48465 RepID=A0A7W7YJY4_9BACT|nr:sulfite exporter TauE/SafE family protein [Prosthecobacter dejongeii]MBB5037556.1 nickel/cobalt exporter [Prosthecobacter dejongeii]
MTDITQLIQSGSAHVWFYIPVAILLGALHGLEPGHSKTMMAAFIIAIRGTVWQAALLGLSAAISHSLLIWVLAALALHYGGQWNADHTEPYFHIASALMIFGLAVWMFNRTRREVAEAQAHDHRDGHGHTHEQPAKTQSTEPNQWNAHSHSHPATPRLLAGEKLTPSGLILPASMNTSAVPSVSLKQGPHGGMLLDTGHGWLEVCIFENGVPPRFRIYPCKASGDIVPLPKGTQLGIETARIDGRSEKFTFDAKESFWEATSKLSEPHEFLAIISLGHSDHAHTYRLRFIEAEHAPVAVEEPEDDGVEYQDAHERAHAQDIAKRFANRTVTTPQIVLFGITGGLMPCPAAFTILVVCLQIKKVVLGFALVAAFSFGLALTMVVVGAIAAWSVQHAHRKIRGFSEWMRRAPYISCALLVLLAAFMAWQGWQGLHGHVGPGH